MPRPKCPREGCKDGEDESGVREVRAGLITMIKELCEEKGGTDEGNM